MNQSGEGPPEYFFWGNMDLIRSDENGTTTILSAGGEEGEG
jgi:hypothetical protein